MTDLTDDDLWQFNEGTHSRLHHLLGGHLHPDGSGATFAVWAPNAADVSVVGDFNGWQSGVDGLAPVGSSGIWQGVAPAAHEGNRYKFRIASRERGYVVDKADPFAVYAEQPPRTASILHDARHGWGDDDWMRERASRNRHDAPISIYELHLGSWRHSHEPGELRSLNYREVARPLAEHVAGLGFTHVELLPVMEHPFYGSWGYQTTGYFAPTSRFGPPEDLMALIDVLHQHGIGVLLDWVPSHFPADEFGLGYFDGTHLYEHADPRVGIHPDWHSLIFNYERHEVRSFLLSSAVSWFERFHIDGLRVDAVASMLYLDYSRQAGEWLPNEHGGNENLGALRFLKLLNRTIYRDFPDVLMVAEESTAWPMVSRPTDVGGLGFGFKWDMGWMHDTLRYFERDPVHRSFHHDELTFRAVYAFTENYVLPLSHDEVVHGKGSLLAKMPGDRWQQLANLRSLLGYQYGLPGKQLLFMGVELGQETEWNHDVELPWHLLDDPSRAGLAAWIGRCNALHVGEPALHELDHDPAGFEWVDAGDRAASVLSWLRWPADRERDRPVLVVAHLSDVARVGYRIGVPCDGFWEELANSDAREHGGSGAGNLGGVDAEPVAAHGREHSLDLTLPPLSVTFFAPRRPSSEPASAGG